MNATETMQTHHRAHTLPRWMASGTVLEAIISIGIIALAIVGLAGIYPLTLAAIATIVAGAATLLEGRTFEGMRVHTVESSRTGFNGMSAELLGAIGGIVLGILALMGVAPLTLMSVAVLLFGATFLLSGAIGFQSAQASRDGFVLLGLGITVLGLLAIIGVSPLTLVLVGLLLFGATGLFGGSFEALRLHESTTE